MKNCIHVFVFLSVLFSANSQTPFSFYPSFNPIEAGLGFGSKVDLDGNEIIASNQRTLVYVFDKNTNGIEQKQIIYSPNTSDGGFGYSISIDNHFIAIGDPLINSVADDAGSVFIYSKAADLYDLQQIIPSPEPTSNYHFGSYVKIYGNKLFISADNRIFGQSAATNIGAVYYYLFNGSEWVFKQKITGIDGNFGKKTFINDSILFIDEQSDSVYSIKTYQFDSNNNYALVSSFGYGNGYLHFDYTLDGNSMYVLYGDYVANIIFNENGTVTFNDDAFITLPQSDQISGSIAVNGDNLFIGSTGYILQMTRKFPLLHYKKNGNTWTYHTTYYGIQPSGDDDFFGSALAIKDNLLIIGAPLERIILPNSGNVYALDYLLANEKFERNGFSLFPNPTNDRVFVINSNSLDIKKLEIYSVSGKLLQTQNANFNEISLENFSAGLYFAKIYSQSDVSQTFKIIKN